MPRAILPEVREIEFGADVQRWENYDGPSIPMNSREFVRENRKLQLLARIYLQELTIFPVVKHFELFAMFSIYTLIMLIRGSYFTPSILNVK